WSNPVLAGQNRFQPFWRGLSRSKPVFGPVFRGLGWSGPVRSDFSQSGPA
ncbi:hypothetical protein CPC197_1970B, partial [Chlamydia psittaci C1/97]